MNTSPGWIKLYRCLLDDPIWQCSTNEQKVILVTLLLMANHAESKWQWNGRSHVCQPGQMITSARSIALKAGSDISRQNVRTALKRFEMMGFLTIRTTTVNTLITICKWEHYQAKPNTVNQDVHHSFTNNPPSSHRVPTTNKNVKNEKNEKNTKQYGRDFYSKEDFESQRIREANELALARWLSEGE